MTTASNRKTSQTFATNLAKSLQHDQTSTRTSLLLCAICFLSSAFPLNPKPETLNPKPLNPKPETRNPVP